MGYFFDEEPRQHGEGGGWPWLARACQGCNTMGGIRKIARSLLHGDSVMRRIKERASCDGITPVELTVNWGQPRYLKRLTPTSEMKVVSMAIYEYANDCLKELSVTNFKSAGVKERDDLQRLLRDQIDVVAPDTLVICEEFGEWEESNRRIDLLAIDSDANLVVIELKRTDDGGHMELQAVRYAAMVSTMTFERAVKVFQSYLGKREINQDAESTLLEFLGWECGSDEEFGGDVRIILVSANFSRELTSAVMWLSERDIDIRCIRMKPYLRDGQLLLDVQQIIPLPEAEEYQIQIKEKQQQQRVRKARNFNPDLTKYDVAIGGQKHEQLAKRHAIFTVIRFLHENGVPPDEIADAVPKKKNRMFFSVDGEVSSDDFVEVARSKASRTGKAFSTKRYYVGENELLRDGGKTYAFSNQWGAATAESIELLIQAFPDHEISFAASALDESK